MDTAPNRLGVAGVALLTPGVLVFFDQYHLVPAALVAGGAAFLILREPATDLAEIDDEIHLPPDDVDHPASAEDPPRP